jgi:hypothetical protein
MNFRAWLVLHESEGESCIKGEWIYYPNGKLQNAIRSDRSRGHTDLISQYYVTKYKKALFDFYTNFRNNPCVNKEKLEREERDVRRGHVHSSGFFFPPSDKTYINHENFGLMYSVISDMISSDVYNNDKECENYIEQIMAKGLDEALGSASSILQKIAMGHGEEQLEVEAMKDAGMILVRGANNFDMYSYDKEKLINCLKAICAKNQRVRSTSDDEALLYQPATMNTTIFVNTFDKGGKSVTTMTVKDLLVGETPQQAFDLPAAHLAVEPFSKAAMMRRDVLRDQWKQRTSESVRGERIY